MIRIALFAAAISSQAFAAVPCASWKDADKAIRAAWAKGYPKEKLVSLEQNGEPSSYDKLKATGHTTIDEHGDTWEALKKNTYCRVPAKAVVEKNGQQTSMEVSAIYLQKGKSFTFDDLGVGESTAVASKGQQAPSKDEIKKLIAAYWLEKHPETKVEKVATSDAELKSEPSTGRWWYYVGADIFITNEDGEKQKCSNDLTNLYKGEQGQEGLSGGDWKVSFLDNPSCN